MPIVIVVIIFLLILFSIIGGYFYVTSFKTYNNCVPNGPAIQYEDLLPDSDAINKCKTIPECNSVIQLRKSTSTSTSMKPSTMFKKTPNDAVCYPGINSVYDTYSTSFLKTL
jgi:hypothetical protein